MLTFTMTLFRVPDLLMDASFKREYLRADITLLYRHWLRDSMVPHTSVWLRFTIRSLGGLNCFASFVWGRTDRMWSMTSFPGSLLMLHFLCPWLPCSLTSSRVRAYCGTQESSLMPWNKKTSSGTINSSPVWHFRMLVKLSIGPLHNGFFCPCVIRLCCLDCCMFLSSRDDSILSAELLSIAV